LFSGKYRGSWTVWTATAVRERRRCEEVLCQRLLSKVTRPANTASSILVRLSFRTAISKVRTTGVCSEREFQILRPWAMESVSVSRNRRLDPSADDGGYAFSTLSSSRWLPHPNQPTCIIPQVDPWTRASIRSRVRLR
jgi:hypothetical protein